MTQSFTPGEFQSYWPNALKMNRFIAYFLPTFIAGLLAIGTHSYGQDFNHFQTLRSSGRVPEKFRTSSLEKYNSDIQQISSKEKRRLKRLKKEFFYESAFDLNNLLHSGMLVFNDPVSIYVNKVMDTILKDDKPLRSKIEIYVLKSTSFNAFTRQNGVIYICVGLLARLHNESELALILCHELTHFTNQHSIQKVIENDDINAGRGVYRKTNEDAKLMAASMFSKKEESEADLVGLQRFLKTNYDPNKAIGEFDIMEYPQLTFNEVPYKKNYLETSNLVFPPSYFLKKISDVVADDDDSLSTHPAAKLRRAAVISKLQGLDVSGKKTFLVGENDFNSAQKICRYEMCDIYLHNNMFQNAFYTSYLLLQENPGSIYLKKCVAKSLYGLSKYKTNGKYSDIYNGYIDIQGYSQQVFYFFNEMKAPELNALAVEYLYNLKRQYPDDKEIVAITQDIMTEMVQYHKDKSFFSADPKPASLDSVLAKDSASKGNILNKSDKPRTLIVQKSKYESNSGSKKGDEQKEKKDDKNYFIRYAFVDLLTDPDFIKDYDKAVINYNETLSDNQYKETREYKKAEAKIERRLRRNGIALGLNKLVIVNPFYYKVDESKSNPVKLAASELAQKDLNNCIKTNANLAGLNYELIDMHDLSENSAEVFNDLSVLNYYSAERSELGDMHYVNYMTDDIQALTKKYQTNYFDWTGVVCYREHSNFRQGYLKTIFAIFSIFYFPLTPYALYNAFRTHYNTYIISNIYDLGTGQSEDVRVSRVKFKDRPDVLNSILYDLYLQYKKPKN